MEVLRWLTDKKPNISLFAHKHSWVCQSASVRSVCVWSDHLRLKLLGELREAVIQELRAQFKLSDLSIYLPQSQVPG